MSYENDTRYEDWFYQTMIDLEEIRKRRGEVNFNELSSIVVYIDGDNVNNYKYYIFSLKPTLKVTYLISVSDNEKYYQDKKVIDLSTNENSYLAEKFSLIDFSKWKETEVEAPDIFGLPHDLCVEFIDGSGVYDNVKHYKHEGYTHLENYELLLEILSEIDKLADIKPKYKKYPPKPTGEWEHIEK